MPSAKASNLPAWIDVHAHLADPRLEAGGRERMLREAITDGMSFSLQGGVSPEDWERQRNLARLHPGRIGVCIGLHPVWVSHASEGERFAGLVGLEQAIHEAAPVRFQGVSGRESDDAPVAWGELGLDAGPGAREGSLQEQQELLVAQLEVLASAPWRREAGQAWRPLVFHVVRAEGSFLETIRRFAPRFRAVLPETAKSWGLIHSVSLSAAGARECLELGLEISFSGGVTRERYKRVRETARALAETPVLVETDCPDQAPCGWPEGALNEPLSIRGTADALAGLRAQGETGEELLRVSVRRFHEAFGWER